MSFPKYPQYKDSCVEWLGEVPAHWDIFPIKRDLELLTSGSRGWASHYADDGAAFIRIGNLTRDHIHLDLADLQRVNVPVGSEGERTKVKPGDVLFSITAYLGSVAVVSDDIETAYVSQHVALARLFKKRLLPGWVAYVTLSDVGKNYLSSQGYGGTKIQLSLEDVADLLVTAPPLCEQASITSFLDHETARIDALVEEQQRLIELLKEKRQAVISHAVTKGLDPDVPMKDSGVEWLGEVPAHWEVAPPKNLAIEKVAGPYGASLTKAMYTTSGYRVYGQQQVIPNDFSSGDYYIPQEKFEEMIRYQVYPGDVLFSVMGTVGKVAVVPPEVEPGIINPRLVRYRFFRRVNPDFIRLLVMSQHYQRSLQESAQGSTMEGLNMSILGDLQILLPDPEEQGEIVAWLTKESSLLEELVSQAKHAMELLNERRSALISAAVTGKIDVRGWQADQQSEQPEILMAAETRATYG
ncbi:restriction endonuclease subunit S [Halomonas alkalicola]|uniref:Restriction endonuclease subunit S n=1 Tax=Halomonas alkalicola TaxID=1930622 RepID=A0ABY9H7N0_9GAMM|nr:restriction endonuclease subunit S [Halomonas alkalicola]WLI74506.1 restriction endonuclease subunit S [Halomonas alkalicola]